MPLLDYNPTEAESFEAKYQTKKRQTSGMEEMEKAYQIKVEAEQPPRLERYGKAFKGGLREAGRTITSFVAGVGEAHLRNLEKAGISPEEVEAVYNLNPRISQQVMNWNPETVGALKKIAQSPILQRRPDEEPKGWMENFVSTAPQIMGQIAATMIAGPFAGGSLMFAQIAGGTYENLKEKGVDPDRAIWAGIANGLMQAPLEQIGAGRITKLFKPQKAILERLKNMGGAAGAEWLTEFVQAYPDLIVNVVAENPDTTVLEKWDKITDKAWEATKQGAYEGTLTAPWALLGLAAPSQRRREGPPIASTAPPAAMLQDMAELSVERLMELKESPRIREMGLISEVNRLIVDKQAAKLEGKEEDVIELGEPAEDIIGLGKPIEEVIDFGKPIPETDIIDVEKIKALPAPPKALPEPTQIQVPPGELPSKPIEVKETGEVRRETLEEKPTPKKAEDSYKAFLAKVGDRLKSEETGQAILDNLEEAGVSPKKVNKDFWTDTYHKLLPEQQKKFDGLVKRLTGLERRPGETWADVGLNEVDLGDNIEGLEGTERGFVSLMAVANEFKKVARETLEEKLPAKAEREPSAKVKEFEKGIKLFRGELAISEHQNPYVTPEGLLTDPKLPHHNLAFQFTKTKRPIHKFMQETGYIRLIGMGKWLGFELLKEPTALQYQAIERAAAGREMIWDISDVTGKIQSTGGAEDIRSAKQQLSQAKYPDLKPKEPTPQPKKVVEKADPEALIEIKKGEIQKERRAKAAKAGTFRQWLNIVGGVNPADPTWKGELSDIRWQLKGKRKVAAPGFPPTFWKKGAMGLDERVAEAVEAGWLPKGSSDQDLMQAIVDNLTMRISEADDINDLIAEQMVDVTDESGFNWMTGERAEEKFELKPDELTDAEKAARQRDEAKAKGAIPPPGEKPKAVIPTEKIAAPTTGKQETLLGPKKGETKDLFDTLKNQKGSISFQKLKADSPDLYSDLLNVSKSAINRGHTSFSAFQNEMRRIFADVWEKVKRFIRGLYDDARRILRSEAGAVIIRPPAKKKPLLAKPKPKVWADEWLDQYEDKETKKIEKVVEQKKKKPLLKKKVRARKEGPPPWEAKRKPTPKGLTEAQKLKRRREKVKAVRDYFNLTDAELRKISRRDIRLMTDYEFKQYIDGVRIRAEKFDIRRQAMNELMTQIMEKELDIENLRKAMKLPTLKNMTVEQIRKLDKALEPFLKGDEFLSVRKLEVVDRTELKGIKTWREARERLSKKLGVPVEQLQNIRVSEWDRFRYDTGLAERNSFYRMMVEETTSRMLISEAEYLKIEKEVFALAKKLKGVGFFIPQHKKIRAFMEAPEGEGIQLSPEEFALARYMVKHFSDAMNYLIQIEAMNMGKQNYFTHVRRGILEAVKEDSLIKAIKEQFESYKLDEQGFNILDRDTGQILAMDKFFKFAMHRTGRLKPTENVVEAFLTYMRTFKKKQALDEIVPLIDIYAYALTPRGLTKKGLLLHGNLIKFVKEWLNTQKGRHVTLVAKQGGKIDAALRAIKMFTSLRDLGINIPVSVATEIGEQITTYQLLGKKRFAVGKIRQNTKQGKAIIEKYRNLIGKNPWGELVEPAKKIGDRLMEGIFVLFRDASVRSNKTFLLGSLSGEEFAKGTISSERLSALRVELGRYRMVQGMTSVIGATPEGKAYTQYKRWAIPILRTTIQNLNNLGKKITFQKPNSKEYKNSILELYRLVEVTAFAMLMFGMIGGDEDKGFISKMIRKAYREATTLIQALGPRMFLVAGRTVSYIEDLGIALTLIVQGETYKTTGEFKGIKKLKRMITPVAISQFVISGRDRKLSLVNRYFNAIGDNDEKRRDEIRKEISNWNKEQKQKGNKDLRIDLSSYYKRRKEAKAKRKKAKESTLIRENRPTILLEYR